MCALVTGVQTCALPICFMNIAAYRSFDPANPTASRFIDEDFNRLWTAAVLDDPARRSAELTRARTLRPYIATVDLLDRKSVVEGKSVSVSVDIGGWRIYKKKKKRNKYVC